MLPGVVPFPPEFAQRYRAKGYWQDKSLAQEFAAVFKTYRERDRARRRREDLHLRRDRRAHRPPGAEPARLGLQAARPRGARAAERAPSSCCSTSRCRRSARSRSPRSPRTASPRSASSCSSPGATTCVYPERQGDFAFEPDDPARAGGESAPAALHFAARRLRGSDRATSRASRTSELAKIRIDPTDPCIFQLSGGTTGIPKLIPRTHNDYAYNSKTAAPVCGVTKRLGAAARAADRAQPAARLPGHPGLFLPGRQGGALADHAPGGDVPR